jgi:hypothetical protein
MSAIAKASSSANYLSASLDFSSSATRPNMTPHWISELSTDLTRQALKSDNPELTAYLLLLGGGMFLVGAGLAIPAVDRWLTDTKNRIEQQGARSGRWR